MARELSRKEIEELYLPPADDFVRVNVPELRFFMLDGQGAEDRAPLEDATQWLFTAIHPIRMEAKKRMGRNFIEPPLEGLWWADDMADFAAGRKAEMKWRLMIPAPGWATAEMFAQAVSRAEKKRGRAPDGLRLDSYHEGESVQIMHVGPNEEEVETLARLHREYLPERELIPNGPHHEIYLFDPRRTAPGKRKTVLRQPVRQAGCTQ